MGLLPPISNLLLGRWSLCKKLLAGSRSFVLGAQARPPSPGRWGKPGVGPRASGLSHPSLHSREDLLALPLLSLRAALSQAAAQAVDRAGAPHQVSIQPSLQSTLDGGWQSRTPPPEAARCVQG